MRRAFVSFLLAFAIALGLVAPHEAVGAAARPRARPAPAVPAPPPVVRSSRIPLYPERPQDKRAGQLIYKGGLLLESGDRRFGGFSDMAVNANGTEILAISDEAHWMRGRLSYDARGDLSSYSPIRMVVMRNMQGRPMQGKDGDAEGMMLEKSNNLYAPVAVSFERNVRVWRYDLSKGLNVTPTAVLIGDWTKKLLGNSQIEALTLVRPDTFIAFGEMQPDEGSDIPAALEAYPGNRRNPNSRSLSVVPHDPFAITSAAHSPDGNGIYVLERRFSITGGLGAEVRYIKSADIRPGARLDGEVIANLSFQDANIDNMEGLAVRQGPKGETFLYLISDNNFSSLQRTLLLMFELRH